MQTGTKFVEGQQQRRLLALSWEKSERSLFGRKEDVANERGEMGEITL
jgi:hypothetical protein